MASEQIGGGVAPGRRGTTPAKPKVRLIPWFVPWDNSGQGGWRLLPQDTTHSVMYIDEHNQQTPAYQAKGFLSESQAQEHVPTLVDKARRAVANAEKERLPAPDWATGVLNRYPDKVKVPAGADAA